jgi:hypothetical protein
MGMEESFGTGTPGERCPHTGLPVRRRPEWTDVELDSGYRVTIFLLGDLILVGRPVGFVSMNAVRGVTSLSAAIVRDFMPPDLPYVHVQDYTGLTGSSLRARRYFIEEMRARKRIKSLIFTGMSPFIRMAVQLAKRLHRFSYDFHFVESYSKAVQLAQSFVLEEGSHVPPPKISEETATAGEGTGPDLQNGDIDNLLRYVGSIDWAKDGVVPPFRVSPDHPLRQVFESIELIKRELDDLIRERRMMEEALKRTQRDLWRKIGERTNELSAARKRIAELEELQGSSKEGEPEAGGTPGSD